MRLQAVRVRGLMQQHGRRRVVGWPVCLCPSAALTVPGDSARATVSSCSSLHAAPAAAPPLHHHQQQQKQHELNSTASYQHHHTATPPPSCLPFPSSFALCTVALQSPAGTLSLRALLRCCLSRCKVIGLITGIELLFGSPKVRHCCDMRGHRKTST